MDGAGDSGLLPTPLGAPVRLRRARAAARGVVAGVQLGVVVAVVAVVVAVPGAALAGLWYGGAVFEEERGSW